MNHTTAKSSAPDVAPTMDVPSPADVSPPADVASPEIEVLPLDRWEGQTVSMVKGSYSAAWSLQSTKRGKYKGCRIRRYDFEFDANSPEEFQGVTGRIKIHSRRSGSSLRSMIEMVVDMNGDGVYSDDEIMLASSREGYKVKDGITDFTSSDYDDALALRRLEPKGKLSFEWTNYSYAAPMIHFDNEGKGNKNNFEGFFADPLAEELIVC